MIDKSFWPSVFSFDTETTGLYPSKKSVLWSAGWARPSGSNEVFLKTRYKNFDKMISDAGQNSVFQRAQAANGAYSPYLEAAGKRGLVGPTKFMDQLIGELASPQIMLMQNANFENKWLSNMADKTGTRQALQDTMEFVTKGGKQYLYRPPTVTNKIQLANDSYKNLFINYTSENVSNYNLSQQEVMKEYSRVMNDPNRKGTVVADLMDFTKALYASGASTKNPATNLPYISKEGLQAQTTRVDYLSQILFGETEKHTAKSDSELQLRIFDKITNIYNELQSGNISPESQKHLENLGRTLPYTTDVTFYRSMTQALEEFKAQGGKYFDYGSNLRSYDVDVASKSAPETELKATVRYYDKNPEAALTTKEDVIAAVEARFGKKADPEILNRGSTEAIIEGLSDRAGQEREKLDNFIRSGEKIFGDRKPFITRRNLIVGGIVGIGLIAGISFLSSQPSKEDGPPVSKQQKRKELNNPEVIFSSMATRPIVYNGSGFYDFDNRKGHHRG